MIKEDFKTLCEKLNKQNTFLIEAIEEIDRRLTFIENNMVRK